MTVLLAEGGSPESFKRLVGPYAKIEPQWHTHVKTPAKGMK